MTEDRSTPAKTIKAPSLGVCLLAAGIVLAVLETMGIRQVLFEKTLGRVLFAAGVYLTSVTLVLWKWTSVEPIVRSGRFWAATAFLLIGFYGGLFLARDWLDAHLWGRGHGVATAVIRETKRVIPQLEPPPVLHFDVPEGWEQLPATGERRMSLRLRAHPETECYMTVLGGTGGGLLANVNRWREQVEQPPIDEAGLATLPKRSLMALPAVVVEATGTFSAFGSTPKPDTTILGLISEVPGSLVTVKMTGPRDVVRAERERFFQIVDSLRLDRVEPGAADPERALVPDQTKAVPDPVPQPRRENEADGFRFEVPEGWTRTADRAFLLAAFTLPGTGDSECTLSVLQGDGGGALENINRWRRQMGLESIPASALAALPRIRVLDQDAYLVELAGRYSSGVGPRGSMTLSDAKMLVMLCSLGGQTVVVKLTGVAAEVDEARPQFEAFCQSLQRTP